MKFSFFSPSYMATSHYKCIHFEDIKNDAELEIFKTIAKNLKVTSRFYQANRGGRYCFDMILKKETTPWADFFYMREYLSLKEELAQHFPLQRAKLTTLYEEEEYDIQVTQRSLSWSID